MLPAVVSELPAWKTKFAFGSPPPSSVSVPVTPMPLAVQYTPAGFVVPPRLATMAFAGGQGSPASVLYAATRSIWFWIATASFRCCTPVITHGGNPVTVLPGLMAMLALMTPPMTQVNAVPAMMPLAAAVLRSTSGGTTGGVTVTVTVAVPEIAPLVALTVLVKVPARIPAVNRPVLPLIVPPPLTTDQAGEIGTMVPLASRPTALNCCVVGASI